MDQGVFGVRGQDGKVQTRPETLTNDVLVGVTWTPANEIHSLWANKFAEFWNARFTKAYIIQGTDIGVPHQTDFSI